MTADGRPRVVSISPTFGRYAPTVREQIEAAGGIFVDASAVPDWQPLVADATALIVGTQPVTQSILESAANLKIVAKHGAGTDNIDVEAATEQGVVVSSAPGLNAIAVAELTMGLVLAAARGIVTADRSVRSGEWRVRVGFALEGSTIGIVGMGAIGRLVAMRAEAFGMRVLAHDVSTDGWSSTWRSASLQELLQQSDFVTLHVPLVPATAGMINAGTLGLMKSTAFIINTSRGGVIDEQALADALRAGRIAGAALDVFANEPIAHDHSLLDVENAILTPHMAGYTHSALAQTSLAVAESVCSALRGELPSGAVNHPKLRRDER